MTPHVKPRGRGTGGERPWWRGHLLLSFCGWFKNILVKIQPHQALPRLSPRQLEADHLADAVIDGPVQLLGLVGGQDQHEPAAGTRRELRARGQQNPPCGVLTRETLPHRRCPLPPIPPCLAPAHASPRLVAQPWKPPCVQEGRGPRDPGLRQIDLLAAPPPRTKTRLVPEGRNVTFRCGQKIDQKSVQSC